MVAGLLTTSCTTRDPDPIEVSVRDVVIDPYAVDGRLVRLHGLLRHGSSGAALYWPQGDIKHSIASHAVGVHYSSPPVAAGEPDGTYVAVEGFFYAARPPRRGWSSADKAIGPRYNGNLVDARPVRVR